MATEDARLVALQIVWDHWMKDDVVARRKRFQTNRIARMSRWIARRLQFENLMIYIDMHDAGIDMINDVYTETFIMNLGWEITQEKIPYGTCPDCGCCPLFLKWDSDLDTLTDTIMLTCDACGYYEELFVFDLDDEDDY